MSAKGFCWSWIRRANILIIVTVLTCLNVIPCESVDYRASSNKQTPRQSPSTLTTRQFDVNPYKHLFDLCADLGYKWGSLYWNEHTKSCCKPTVNCGPNDDSRKEDFGIVFCTENRTRDICEKCLDNFIQPNLVHSIINPASSAVCFEKPRSPDCPVDEAKSTAQTSRVSSCPINCECNLDSCWYGVDPCRCQEPKQDKCPLDHEVNRISGDCVPCPSYGYKIKESCGPCWVNLTLISMPNIPVKTTVQRVPSTTRSLPPTEGSSGAKSTPGPFTELDERKKEDPQEQNTSVLVIVIAVCLCCVLIVAIVGSVIYMLNRKRCPRTQSAYREVPSSPESPTGTPVVEKPFNNVITGGPVHICQVHSGTQNIYANPAVLHQEKESNSANIVPVYNGNVGGSPPTAPPQEAPGIGLGEPEVKEQQLQGRPDTDQTYPLVPHMQRSDAIQSISPAVLASQATSNRHVRGERTPKDHVETKSSSFSLSGLSDLLSSDSSVDTVPASHQPVGVHVQKKKGKKGDVVVNIGKYYRNCNIENSVVGGQCSSSANVQPKPTVEQAQSTINGGEPKMNILDPPPSPETLNNNIKDIPGTRNGSHERIVSGENNEAIEGDDGGGLNIEGVDGHPSNAEGGVCLYEPKRGEEKMIHMVAKEIQISCDGDSADGKKNLASGQERPQAVVLPMPRQNSVPTVTQNPGSLQRIHSHPPTFQSGRNTSVEDSEWSIGSYPILQANVSPSTLNNADDLESTMSDSEILHPDSNQNSVGPQALQFSDSLGNTSCPNTRCVPDGLSCESSEDTPVKSLYPTDETNCKEIDTVEKSGKDCVTPEMNTKTSSRTSDHKQKKKVSVQPQISSQKCKEESSDEEDLCKSKQFDLSPLRDLHVAEPSGSLLIQGSSLSEKWVEEDQEKEYSSQDSDGKKEVLGIDDSQNTKSLTKKEFDTTRPALSELDSVGEHLLSQGASGDVSKISCLKDVKRNLKDEYEKKSKIIGVKDVRGVKEKQREAVEQTEAESSNRCSSDTCGGEDNEEDDEDQDKDKAEKDAPKDISD